MAGWLRIWILYFILINLKVIATYGWWLPLLDSAVLYNIIQRLSAFHVHNGLSAYILLSLKIKPPLGECRWKRENWLSIFDVENHFSPLSFWCCRHIFPSVSILQVEQIEQLKRTFSSFLLWTLAYLEQKNSVVNA